MEIVPCAAALAHFFPKFSNEQEHLEIATSSEGRITRDRMFSLVDAGLCVIEVSPKHSGSLGLLAGVKSTLGNDSAEKPAYVPFFAAKNSVENHYTKTAAAVVRGIQCAFGVGGDERPAGFSAAAVGAAPAAVSSRFQGMLAELCEQRMSLGMEVVTRQGILGDHGALPEVNYAVVTAVTNLAATGSTPRFANTAEIVRFCTRWGMLWNQCFVFSNKESLQRFFDMYDAEALEGNDATILGPLVDLADFYIPSVPHGALQGSVLEGLVVRAVPVYDVAPIVETASSAMRVFSQEELERRSGQLDERWSRCGALAEAQLYKEADGGLYTWSSYSERQIALFDEELSTLGDLFAESAVAKTLANDIWRNRLDRAMQFRRIGLNKAKLAMIERAAAAGDGATVEEPIPHPADSALWDLLVKCKDERGIHLKGFELVDGGFGLVLHALYDSVFTQFNKDAGRIGHPLFRGFFVVLHDSSLESFVAASQADTVVDGGASVETLNVSGVMMKNKTIAYMKNTFILRRGAERYSRARWQDHKSRSEAMAVYRTNLDRCLKMWGTDRVPSVALRDKYFNYLLGFPLFLEQQLSSEPLAVSNRSWEALSNGRYLEWMAQYDAWLGVEAGKGKSTVEGLERIFPFVGLCFMTYAQVGVQPVPDDSDLAAELHIRLQEEYLGITVLSPREFSNLYARGPAAIATLIQAPTVVVVPLFGRTRPPNGIVDALQGMQSHVSWISAVGSFRPTSFTVPEVALELPKNKKQRKKMQQPNADGLDLNVAAAWLHMLGSIVPTTHRFLDDDTVSAVTACQAVGSPAAMLGQWALRMKSVDRSDNSKAMIEEARRASRMRLALASSRELPQPSCVVVSLMPTIPGSGKSVLLDEAVVKLIEARSGFRVVALDADDERFTAKGAPPFWKQVWRECSNVKPYGEQVLLLCAKNCPPGDPGQEPGGFGWYQTLHRNAPDNAVFVSISPEVVGYSRFVTLSDAGSSLAVPSNPIDLATLAVCMLRVLNRVGHPNLGGDESPSIVAMFHTFYDNHDPSVFWEQVSTRVNAVAHYPLVDQHRLAIDPAQSWTGGLPIDLAQLLLEGLELQRSKAAEERKNARHRRKGQANRKTVPPEIFAWNQRMVKALRKHESFIVGLQVERQRCVAVAVEELCAALKQALTGDGAYDKIDRASDASVASAALVTPASLGKQERDGGPPAAGMSRGNLGTDSRANSDMGGKSNPGHSDNSSTIPFGELGKFSYIGVRIERNDITVLLNGSGLDVPPAKPPGNDARNNGHGAKQPAPKKPRSDAKEDAPLQVTYVSNPHITLHHKASGPVGKDLVANVGMHARATVDAILVRSDRSLAAARVSDLTLVDGGSVDSKFRPFPHVTLWTAPGVSAVQSNQLPDEVQRNTARIVMLPSPMCMEGPIQLFKF